MRPARPARCAQLARLTGSISRLGIPDHGENRGDAVTGTAEQAQGVFDAVAAQGVDLEDVFRVLEDDGVDKFDKSWAELLDTVKGQLDGAKA